MRSEGPFILIDGSMEFETEAQAEAGAKREGKMYVTKGEYKEYREEIEKHASDEKHDSNTCPYCNPVGEETEDGFCLFCGDPLDAEGFCELCDYDEDYDVEYDDEDSEEDEE